MRSSLPRLLALSAILAFAACEQESCDCSGGSAAGNGSGSGSGEASGAASKAAEGSAAPAPVKTMKIASGFDPSRLGTEVLPPDWAEQALVVYNSDCAAGDPNACVLEANAYHDGTGAKQDWGKARELYESGCNASNFAACLRLRDMYRFEEGVAKDLEKADALLKKVATDGAAACRSGGSAISCIAAATATLEAKPDQDSNTINPAVVELYEAGCKQGLISACLELGNRMVQVSDDAIAARGLAFLRQSCDARYEQGCEMLRKYEPKLKEVELKLQGKGR
jgi:TPR repeat protein